MPTVTRTLKLARTSESEITALADILNDLETFQNSGDIDYYSDISTVDFSQYNTLCKFKGNSPEQLIEFICEQVSIIHFQRILMNTATLLENCTDPDFTHLEFSPDIKRGLELVELEKKRKAIALNANQYHINTVNDMINCTNEENIDRFLFDLKIILTSAHNANKLFNKVEDTEGLHLKSDGFTWIDDGKHHAEIEINLTGEE